jgi:riboflavin synthase
MFTGLIEHMGTVRELAVRPAGGALSVDLGPLADDLRSGASIAIDGCCLTVAALAGRVASFDISPETLRRTTLGSLRRGDGVNLERALAAGARLGGHFVQGHVDGTAVVREARRADRYGEWHFALDDQSLAPCLVEKGSIAVDGISLTVAGCDGRGGFWVALIPETLERTTLGRKLQGARVNVETDILGKYVLAFLQRGARGAAAPKISEEWLKEMGY